MESCPRFIGQRYTYECKVATTNIPFAECREQIRNPSVYEAFNPIENGFFNPDFVRIQDASNVAKLLDTIRICGPDSLRVIMDFDQTLTRFKDEDGRRCECCYEIINNARSMSKEYGNAALELYQHYYPVLVNEFLTPEEKKPHMIEWQTQTHKNILHSQPKIRRTDISQMVLESNVALRDKTKETFQMLHEYGVPVFVVSAGIGNIVEEVLKQNQIKTENISVISNFIEFQNDDIVRFKEPFITMYNKQDSRISPNIESQKMNGRQTVLLLGDTLEDAEMDQLLSSSHSETTFLKIGFLNTKIEQNLAAFMSAFDIVLLDDQPMDLIYSIINSVLNPKSFQNALEKSLYSFNYKTNKVLK